MQAVWLFLSTPMCKVPRNHIWLKSWHMWITKLSGSAAHPDNSDFSENFGHALGLGPALRASRQDLSMWAPPSQGVGIEQTVTYEVNSD